MAPPVADVLNPQQLVLPNVTTTIRDLMVCELGTIIYNTTTNKLNVCDVAQTAHANSWSVVTSS